MSEITPVTLESMIAMSKTAQSVPRDQNNLEKSAIEKAFVSLLMENMNLIGATSISGETDKKNDSHLLIDRIFKDWLIEQELGLGYQAIDKDEV